MASRLMAAAIKAVRAAQHRRYAKHHSSTAAERIKRKWKNGGGTGVLIFMEADTYAHEASTGIVGGSDV